MGWPQRGQTFYYKEPLDTKTTNSRVQQPPTPQSLRDIALRDSFGNMNVPSSQAVLRFRTAPSGRGAVIVPRGVRLPKTSANELKPNLFEFLQRVQQCFNKVKGNKRSVQLSRSGDRSNYKAMVTRSVAKGYAAWVAVAKRL